MKKNCVVLALPLFYLTAGRPVADLRFEYDPPKSFRSNDLEVIN